MAAGFPIPIGVTTSFAGLMAGVNSPTFTLDAQTYYVVTFQPVDPNHTGSLTLYDSGDNAVTTLLAGGWDNIFSGTGGSGYYFNASLGANIAAITNPSILR